ncbi:hypothetical protein DSO57_1001754 [Entomophthora muscae]|uniref:Uncharacterized protein n=1 Tax=Entomophthora muscae TaxID=34485 RepID=A0ACC2T906_9FUNG|nr:hypothetical protein DSO57_1001754 [Entomophthora muscae]
MKIFLNQGNLGSKMLITLGTYCMLFSFISAYYAYKLVTNLIASAIRHQYSTELKDALLGVEKTKIPNLQVQDVIVNQSMTKVEMPQMGKLTLEEARRAMPALCLHFQANTNSYSNNTEKVLRVASMLSDIALDWFRKTTAVTVGSIMPGIVRPSKKAQKARKPVSKLTKLTD